MVYILIIYIHLILQTCMSSKGWSRGIAFQHAAWGHSIDAQTLQICFLILVQDIRIFLSFWQLFFQFRNQQEKWGQPTLFAFLQVI